VQSVLSGRLDDAARQAGELSFSSPAVLVQVERMVAGIAAGLRVPLTAKIRIFPELHRTLAYARMLERCGVQLLAVHGRTREQKDSRAHKADWDAIKVAFRPKRPRASIGET
jgi:tRNA-dihydrouridine synthase